MIFINDRQPQNPSAKLTVYRSLFISIVHFIFPFICGTGISCNDATSDDDDAVDTNDTSTQDDQEQQLRGQCKAEENLHGFLLLDHLDTVTQNQRWSLDGYVYDNVVPASIGQVVDENNTCRILQTPMPICDPPCDNNQACTLDGECIAYPLKQNLGTVTINGLKQQIDITPLSGNHYYTDLPETPYELGQWMELATSGEGFVGKQILYGRGIESLEMVDNQWLVARDQPLSIKWIAASWDVSAQIELYLSIDQHGISKGRLVCLFPDTGSAEVPVQIINALFDIGASGLPTGTLTRMTADSLQVDIDKCVHFYVSSRRQTTVILVP